MLKPLLFLLAMLACGAGPAQAQSQPGPGLGLVQPFSGPLQTPGGTMPGGSLPDPVHMVPPAPATILRPLTAAKPVVVELFTAEGCSSCPPADRYLADLAQRRDLLALSFHVDYWDYTGWQDRFAAPAFGARQHAYAKAKGENMVYTPQIVIAGALPMLGSDRVAVEAGLRAARNRKVMAEPVLAKDAGGDIRLTLPATPLSVPASLWFVTFTHRDQSDVTAGENNGQRVVSVNIVRTLRKLGQWQGGALTQSIRLTPEEMAAAPDACAIIANEAEFGPVVAAAAWNFRDLY
ncbi:DUF1223 domain-containing protein [Dongia sp.]|uniref:DUF1223 domain-containing protein n=1 Tax=Dongia sp. TaxID=1977262 RepID=UPI0035AD9FBD